MNPKAPKHPIQNANHQPPITNHKGEPTGVTRTKSGHSHICIRGAGRSRCRLFVAAVLCCAVLCSCLVRQAMLVCLAFSVDPNAASQDKPTALYCTVIQSMPCRTSWATQLSFDACFACLALDLSCETIRLIFFNDPSCFRQLSALQILAKSL